MAKISNKLLLSAVLDIMSKSGRPLTRIPTGSRAMKYRLSNGETVRVRTCNDHVLVVLADHAGEGARLNIEGTDHLLVVMPEVPRTEGALVAYLVPTDEAVKAVRDSHAEWLASQPSTKGNNRTWNIWFEDFDTPWSGFARKWNQYRLDAQGSMRAPAQIATTRRPNETARQLGDVIAQARREIAEAAGVSIESVKISLQLE